MKDRRQEARNVRHSAAERAYQRTHPRHQANGDEERYAGDAYFMSFTKGLPHNPATGLLADPEDFRAFRKAINTGRIEDFTDAVRHGGRFEADASSNVCKVQRPSHDYRQWEAPTAGRAFDLEGPDAQAVTMPPAPPLCDHRGLANAELIFELAEVYELAIIRDEPLNDLEDGGNSQIIRQAIGRLNQLAYLSNQTGRPRKTNRNGKLDEQTVFRGSAPGVEVGPYLSQFLLMGTPDPAGRGSAQDGRISYGAATIDQRVIQAEHESFMVTMPNYVEVQRGRKPQRESYVFDNHGRTKRRFITTPRDLATYVHYDVLYQAYLNACLILLSMSAPFDPGFDHLSGHGKHTGTTDPVRRHAGGFALYGGAHILTLVTEVTTRALKAVRYQKFNNHLRLRPEALAARLELTRIHPELDADVKATVPPALIRDVRGYVAALLGNGQRSGRSTLATITEKHLADGTYFLPMAFPEGSPMHPSYGAGHAVVAGACVTILKAFFDTSAVLARNDKGSVVFKRRESGDVPAVFRAPAPGSKDDFLVEARAQEFLTLEGELNKLAANVSIGRNMAGVHYFSDYYDSLRMGEQVAIGLLEEQALTYGRDGFVVSVGTFEGDVVAVGR